MDQKKLLQHCKSLARVVQNADAGRQPKRAAKEDIATHPFVITAWLPRETQCDECDRVVTHRIHRLHRLQPTGWRSHCMACNLWRLPGTTHYGAPQVIAQPALCESPAVDPMPAQQSACQSHPTEVAPSEPAVAGFVEQVVVTECHEFVIKEYLQIPISSQPE
jgi:hypothetical protein